MMMEDERHNIIEIILDGGNFLMTTQEIVSKLWNLCNVLRDDGITYHQYVTELTYILFLKMAKETGAESQIPEKIPME